MQSSRYEGVQDADGGRGPSNTRERRAFIETKQSDPIAHTEYYTNPPPSYGIDANDAESASAAQVSVLEGRTISSASPQWHREHIQMPPSGRAADSERTPRKYSASPLSPRIPASAMEYGGSNRTYGASEGGSSRRRPDLPDLQRRSVSRLRNQTSTATLRSGEGRRDEITSSMTDDADRDNRSTAGPGALRQERRRKSAIWERDVSRMRSESRSAFYRSETPETQSSVAQTSSQRVYVDHSLSRASAQTPSSHTGDSAADTSGTEGSGPVMGDRRRKKSSTGSASKRVAARAAQAKPTPTHTSTAANDESIGDEDTRHSLRRSSDSSRPTANGVGDSGGRRSALHAGSLFKQDQLRDASGIDEKRAWPRSEQSTDVGARTSSMRFDSPRTSHHRPRRFASDADVSPYLEPGAASSSGRASRVSVDTSGISRYLGHSPSVVRPRVSPSSHYHQHNSEEAVTSPSEAARQRKISTSSTLSLRSSGGASDLHRSASRASMRRAHGRDVFDDAPPPLPDHSIVRAQSPRLRSSLERRNGPSADSIRGQPLRDRFPRTPDGDTMSSRTTSAPLTGLEELRARLDDLTSASSHPLRNPSRSSSRASRARSNMSSTPALSNAGTSSTSVRPATEPRKTHEYHHVELSPESKRIGATLRRAQMTPRLGTSGTVDDSAPITPDSLFQGSRRPGSRLLSVHATGSQQQSSQRPSAIQNVAVDVAHSTADTNRPLHARNLFASMDSLEQQLFGTSPNDLAMVNGWPEVAHMLNCFRDSCTSAVEINQSLRSLVEALTAYQVDAEMASSSHETVAVCAELERGLGSIVRWSDDQLRNLTDSLMVLALCRKTLAILPVNSAEEAGTMRTGTASRAAQHSKLTSPPTERTGQAAAANLVHRRASLDLRRTPNATTTLRASPSISRPDGAISQSSSLNAARDSPKGQSPSRSRNSSDSGHRSLSDRSIRRYSIALTSSNGSPNLATLASARSNVQPTSSRLRQSGHPAVDASSPKDRVWQSPASSRSGSGTNSQLHGRSMSDLSFAPTDRDVSAIVPHSLSPKKPRPSLASVTTVNATHQAAGNASGDGSVSAVATVDGILSQHLAADSRMSNDNAAVSSSNATSVGDSRHSTLARSSRRLLGRQYQQEQPWATSSYDEAASSSGPLQKNDRTRSEGTMGLGLENATARMIRSLGRHAGKQHGRDADKHADHGGNVDDDSGAAALQAVPSRLQQPQSSGHASDASID